MEQKISAGFSVDPVATAAKPPLLQYIRPDFIFSYWILSWFLIYYFVNLSKKSSSSSSSGGLVWITKYNPFLALCLGVLENIVFATYIYFYSSMEIFVHFILSMILIKFFPLYLLWKTPIKPARDLSALFVLFLVYLGWLYIHGLNSIVVYKKVFEYVTTGQSKTPLFSIFDSIEKWIKQYFV